MTRQKKDANAPKRPLSAYIIYCQEQRDILKKKNPELKATELTSQLGKMWKSLSDDKKKQYNVKHEKERERYQKEMKDYTPPEKEQEEKKSKRKSKKDSTRPKRAPSAYIIFCQDKRSEVKERNPSFGPKEITSKLGELWRELDVETKASYSRKSREMSPKKESDNSHEKDEDEEEDEEEEEVKPQKKERPKKQRKSRNRQEEEEELEDDE